MIKAKGFTIKGIDFYIQYWSWHFGIAIEYVRFRKAHSIALLLPFIIISIEIPTKK